MQAGKLALRPAANCGPTATGSRASGQPGKGVGVALPVVVIVQYHGQGLPHEAEGDPEEA